MTGRTIEFREVVLDVKDTFAFVRCRPWRVFRLVVLSIYGHTCMRCKVSFVRGMSVDHIFGRHSHPELAFELRNLQVLCHSCNARKGRASTDYRPADWRQKIEAAYAAPPASMSTRRAFDVTWRQGRATKQ